MSQAVRERLAAQAIEDMAVMNAAKGKKGIVETVINPNRAERRIKLEAAASEHRVVVIQLSDLVIRGNVREIVDQEGERFQELVASIQEHGLEQSLLVAFKPIGDDDFELIVVAGQRRKLALERLGVQKAPVILRPFTTEEDLIQWGLAENLNREDLHFFDFGQAYASLMRLGLDQTKIAKQWEKITGHGTQMISRAVTASRFPAEVKSKMRSRPDIFKVSVICNHFCAKRGSIYEDDNVLLAEVNKIIEAGKMEKIAKESISHDDVEKAWKLPANSLAGRISGSKKKGRIILYWKSEEEYESVGRLFSKT